MKRFSIFFAIVAALFVSCDQENGIEALGFEIEKDTIYADPEGGTHMAMPRTIRRIVLGMLSWAMFLRKYLMGGVRRKV